MSAIETTEFAMLEPEGAEAEPDTPSTREIGDRFVSRGTAVLALAAAVGATVELASAFPAQIVVGIFIPAALLCLLAGFLVQVARRESPLTRRVALRAVPSTVPVDEPSFRRTPLSMGPPVSA